MAHFILREDFPLGTARGNTCYLCASVASENEQDGKMTRVIDTNIHIDMEGWLMICEACATQMGKLIGLMTPRQAAILQNKLKAAEGERDEARIHLSITEDALNSLTRYNETVSETN